MRRIVKALMIIVMLLASFSIALAHHEHVHAYGPGDAIGICPDCGAGQLIIMDMEVQATCTENGAAYVMCSNCSYGIDAYPLPALGHDYVATIIKEATCTENGLVNHTCSRCNASYDEEIAATGHNYLSKITKAATCTDSGGKTFTCQNCNHKYTQTIAALGHKFIYEEKEATCLEDGYKKGKCSRCGEESEEIFPALGHDLEDFIIIKEATCEEDGLKQATCKRCGETVEETIEKLGHDYPDEWTIEKEAGFFSEGLEAKTCTICNKKIEQVIPKKSPLPLVLGGVGGLGIAGGIFFLLKKSGRLGKKAVEEVLKESGEKTLPAIGSKTILSASKDEEFTRLLKERRFLKIVTCEYADLEAANEENEPDLIIVDILSEERLEDMKTRKEDALKEVPVGLVVDGELIEDRKDELDKLVKDKKIVGYVPFGTDVYEALVKIVLPVLKPDLKSDTSLGNIGMVADALGIPGVSNVINVYVSGRDIKATLEEGELGLSSTATIIGDIASILGLDKVASVAGLVSDVESVKAVFDKEAGTYEVAEGAGSAKDIVDVVSDIIKKD